MGKMTVERFRAEAEKRRAGRVRGTARYTAELREFALQHARKLEAEGKARAQAAKELGLCDVTLYGWQKRQAASAGKLQRVRVCDEPRTLKRRASPSQASSLSVTTPDGYVVSGLDVDSTVALLRALG